MTRQVGSLSAVALGLLLAGAASANNLTVANVALSPSGGGQAVISFDLSWEHSWRDAENFDAAWMFVKYSTDGGTRWRHATLAAAGTNPPACSPGTNTLLEIIVPADKKGALIQRAVPGTGAVATAAMQLAWDFAADGVSVHAQAIVKVMGIEMVYIPRGSFTCGDNPTWGTKYLHALPVTLISTPDLAQVATEGSGTIADPYRNPAGCGRPGGVTGTFAPGYPNGFNPYYIMKYEPSEALYVDFLNTLTRAQAISRYLNLASQPTYAPRHSVSGLFTTVNGVFTSSVPDRAIGFYLWYEGLLDAAALVDWAALRPATELEFIKAARGPAAPVEQEFAWGSPLAVNYAAPLVNDGTPTEAPAQAHANLNNVASKPDGPIRSGAFATNGSSRVKSGAGYYGVLELSGNLKDRVLPTGGQERTGAAIWPSYNGGHGDGELTPDGRSNTATLPVLGQYTYAACGGSWADSATECAASARRTWSYLYQNGSGLIRAARTAP